MDKVSPGGISQDEANLHHAEYKQIAGSEPFAPTPVIDAVSIEKDK